MVMEVVVTGPALVRVDTGASNALEDLGYTENGAEIEFRGFFGDVPGDENGGDQGPPIDVQYFGEIAIVRLTFTRFDPAIADKVTPRLYGGSVGQPGTPGSLMFQGANTFRLLINPISSPYNFPRVINRGSQVVNKGTKFMRLIQEWECHKDGSGVLHDTTIA